MMEGLYVSEGYPNSGWTTKISWICMEKEGLRLRMSFEE